MAAAFLIMLGVYLACGLVFAIPFALVGVRRIDSHAVHGSWGFRLLIIPGAMAFWPLLLKRWLNGTHEPPEERDAHRVAVGEAGEGRRDDGLTKEDEVNRSLLTSAATGELP